MNDNGTAPAHGTTGGTRWQGRVALLLLAAVVLYYVAMAGLNLAGFFDYREFSVTDTSTYRYIGRRMAEGAVLYTDVWDIKGPMIYLTYYWGYLLSGGAPWGVELAILAYSLLATCCCYRALRCVSAPLPSAVAVVLMSATVGFIGWCGTTGESTYTLLALIGLMLTLPVQGANGKYGWRWIAAGSLVGLCVLCKANYVGFGCFLLVYWALRGCFWRAAAASAAGFAALLGVVCLVMWGRGNLGDMVDASVLFNLQEYHAAAPEWAVFPALPEPLASALTILCAEFQYAKHFVHVFPCMALLLAVSCTLLWWRRRSEGSLRPVTMALIVWVAAELLAGGVKFLIYDHYYETIFLPICLLTAAATSALRTAWVRRSVCVLMFLAAGFSAGPWVYFRPLDAPYLLRLETQALQLNPQRKPVAVIGGADVLHTLNRLGMHSNQRYAHCQLMLDYDLTPARRQELLDELAAALEQAPLLLSEEPLSSLISRHPDLAPLLHGWRAVDDSPQNRVFLYQPTGVSYNLQAIDNRKTLGAP